MGATQQKFFDIVFDGNLNFDEYTFNNCKKEKPFEQSYQNNMSFEKRRSLLKVFAESKFRYCLLTLIFRGGKENSKQNNVCEKGFVIGYKYNALLFEPSKAFSVVSTLFLD